jgi:hypothetical protein
LLKRARFAVGAALVMAPGARPARATARLATQPSAHPYFVTNAAFSYLGPSFAVLLFARVQVLGVVHIPAPLRSPGSRTPGTPLPHGHRAPGKAPELGGSPNGPRPVSESSGARL